MIGEVVGLELADGAAVSTGPGTLGSGVITCCWLGERDCSLLVGESDGWSDMTTEGVLEGTSDGSSDTATVGKSVGSSLCLTTDGIMD